MKKLSLFVLIGLIAFVICFINHTPYSYPTISKFTPQNDGLIYSFNKEKYDAELDQKKEELIKKASSLIAHQSYFEAKSTLENSEFNNDKKVVVLLNTINKILKAQKMQPYSGKLTILEFNPLISFPEVLKKNSSFSTQIDENQITIDEFERVLLGLYNNNYILVNLASFSQNTPLPRGKKPLVLLLNSSEYNIKLGNVDKLMLDDNNNLTTYTPKRSINDRIHHSNDFITALSVFVENHPTFSHNNAKGHICVDGSRGILGYKTQKTNANSKFQIKKCTELATHLKDEGWQFVSKGYKYGVNDSDINFSSGLSHWREIVEPIIGNTPIYYGNFDTNINDYKLSLFETYNYNTFISYNSQTPDNTPQRLFLTQLISGKTLRESKGILAKYFDCEKVYDHINRNTTFCIA